MNKHTESILVFGVILPGVILIALLGGVLFGRAKLHASTDAKLELYRDYEQSVASLQSAEGDFAGRKDNLKLWQDSIEKELIQTLTANLRLAMEEYTDDQLRQIELSRPQSTSPFAGSTENHYDRFLVSFEGGFGPMQRTLAELETRMPQLTLESLNVGPSAQAANDPGPRKLKFVATYLSWREKE